MDTLAVALEKNTAVAVQLGGVMMFLAGVALGCLFFALVGSALTSR